MLHNTTQIIEDVFGENGALLSALKTVINSGWSSGIFNLYNLIFFVNLEIIKLIISDQLSDYDKLINDELLKINDSYSKKLIIQIPIESVKNKCTHWLKQSVYCLI